MQASEAEAKYEQEIRYYASCYVSKQHAEVIFSIMQVEFVDQLCEREPVAVFDLATSPEIVGLALKAILAESNKQSAKNNSLLSATLSDISQGKIFYNRKDYATHQVRDYPKQDNIGKVYHDAPGYQASKATIMKEFNRHYLQFLVRATDKILFAKVSFNEWNPIQFSKQVPLDIKNEELGALFLGFSRLCIW